jgi:hypothetical protein
VKKLGAKGIINLLGRKPDDFKNFEWH